MTTSLTQAPIAAVATPPAHTYTLVCYRANGVDTCRGCVMGRSDSDFELRVFTSPEDVAFLWAQKLRENASNGREYCDWDITLLIDGKEDWYDEEGNECPAMEAAFENVKGLLTLADEAVSGAERRAKALQEQKRAAQAAADAERTERARQVQMRADYERLRKVFEGPGAR